MEEFMLLIHNRGDAKTSLSPEKYTAFLKKCEVYIEQLKKEGKLISAQPLVREGVIIYGTTGAWKESPLDDTNEIQVGYYHIMAKDMDEAVAIAKQNPEFEFTFSAQIEVRPIKSKEEDSGYVYPRKTL